MWAALARLTEYGTDQPLSLDDLYNETMIMLIAGYDTTSTALSWTLYLLATHPQVMDKLEEEFEASP